MGLNIGSTGSEKMNLAWLKMFNAIVDEGSLTKAAQSLHLTQPAVSKQLCALEEYYGMQLIFRTTRTVELTEAGKIVYQCSQKTLELIKKSRDEVERLTSTVRGELRIGASTIPGEYVLPRLLGLFQQLYPAVIVKLEIGDSKDIAQKVLDRRMELGIIGTIIKNRGLRHELFFKDELVAVVPGGHRFAGREMITLSEFMAEPLVIRERGSGTRSVMEKRLRVCGAPLSDLNVKLELGSTEAVLNAVSQGLGISLVSLFAVQPRVQTGELAYLRIADLSLERGLYFICRKNIEPTAITRIFTDFLKDRGVNK